MPELPEVETVRIGLSTLLPGKQVRSVWHDWPKGFPNAASDVAAFLEGATIRGVRRRAKVLLIDVSTDYTIVIHLKMTGQLVFRGGDARFGAGHPNESLVGELPDKSTRVVFTFTDDSKLFFNDQRKFGWVRLMPTVEVETMDFFQKVGPEPLAADFTAAAFIARLRRRHKSGIKAVLLDQTVVAGIGNIYADESLWGAKIHPETRVQDVPDEQLEVLFAALQAVLQTSIEKGGSTDRNYVNAEGKRGSYLTFANVFRREGKPCPRCGTTIIKTRVAGRGTHTCPVCQPKPYVIPDPDPGTSKN
ncbi:MAG TPA: bifunctional DNA-formamidopyrimidine glycosylase/DNA-(apurinic or apyrimidinic site) lyase [Candidatus Saccharimonadales bacterium]|nr:bifunctional DNA-formamidopyrimidine glycosylase/DNA-(apurinic or apyrimidinic site) lyase [Candidatus Saccharimonadales bacterium]